MPQEVTRECGGCTACCKVMGVPELSKPAFVVCGYAAKKIGCTAYDKRPESCREFNCLWAYGLTPEDDRPDKAGIVLLPTGDQKRVQAMEVWPGASVGGRGGAIIDAIREGMEVIVVRQTGPRTFLTVKGQPISEDARRILER